MAFASYSNLEDVHIVNNVHEWQEVEKKFRDSIGHIHAIGLDCEWVVPEHFPAKDTRDHSVRYYDDRVDELRRFNAAHGKVALLQMATHEGVTVLVRLCLFDEVPPSLKDLLEDWNIVKLGVNIELDVKKLFTTWGVLVTSFVDVRNVFGQNRRFLEEYNKDGLGLKRLGAFLVNEKETAQERTKTIRFSNWAAKRLTRDQIEYASKDARMAVESLISFAISYVDGMPESKLHPAFWPRLRDRLQNHIGRPCAAYLINFDKTDFKDDEEENGSTANGRKGRRRGACETLDTSSSDVELDFAGWQSTKDYKRVEKQNGADRAAVFYATDDRGNQRPLAAVDSAFLAAMTDAGERKAQLRYKVKHGRGDDMDAYDAKVTLRRLGP